MEDWPLHAFLWAGVLPEDLDERERLESLAERFRANDNELQTFLVSPVSNEGRWVNVAPILSRPGILVDTHRSLGHCGRDKLLQATR